MTHAERGAKYVHSTQSTHSASLTLTEVDAQAGPQTESRLIDRMRAKSSDPKASQPLL